ncbi:MAG TPA: efflux RND transporter permease subunit [Bryobacteraceae bacterium]|nr:efflux RND transporter permease subunit [Bryobacteraceae bacterium]
MHKLAEICVKRPVFATMLILALMVVGTFSFFTLGVDLFPKIDLPTVSVTVSNPGASAEEIETDITKRVEDSVNTISGIDELRSTSVEGQSTVIVTFNLDKNGDVGAQEIRDKVNLIVNDLPDTAKAPVVQKFDPDATPIMEIALSSPRPLREVTEIADKVIKPQLENINGIGQIQLVGGLKREIRVWVDPDKMRAYNLAISDVANALRQQNMEMPAGNVNAGARELAVRTLGRLVDPAQFNEIAIAQRGSYVVKLRDIGHAEDSQEEATTAARLNGEPSVTMVVSKQSGQNTVAAADALKVRIKQVEALLPKDIHIQITNDQSIFIKAAVHSLEQHLIEGSILAAAIVFAFLANIRTTLISAVAIPTSIVSTFALMAAIGFDLNQITMLALTLMVGIVIDDAIIVLENIYRFIEEKGMSPYRAAIEGTKEIGLAVMATTLSLLAVFLPIGFMGGIVGRFMSSFGFTASFAIAVSLLVSFTLTPMLTSRFIKVLPKHEGEKHGGSKDSRFFRFLDRYYTRMLVWSMGHRKAMVAISVGVALSTVPLFMVVGKNFMAQDDRSEFAVNVRAPEGTSLAATVTITERIARDIRTLPGVSATLTSVGIGSASFTGSTAGESNSSSIYVKLKPREDRKDTQNQVMAKARAILTHYPKDLRTSVGQAANGPGGGQSDVQFTLTGPDLDKLNTYAQALLEKMRRIPYVADADSSLVFGKPELRVEIDRQRAADLGVRVSDIAQALNTMVAGQVVSSFPSGGEEYDVRLRADMQYRTSAEGLRQLTVFSTNTRGWVPLDQVVRIKSGDAPSSIGRLNRQRQVTLSANVLPGGSQQKIISTLNQYASDLHMDPGYGTELVGTSKELNRTAYYFVLAIALTFIFMYIVLAAQFESFLHPFTILLTLPLAVPFGILSLLIFGQTVNIMSGLGLLLLFGIVKKNAILQIDHTNGLRATGMNRYEAIIQANRDRLRPILMTTTALVAGMLPLVVSNGEGSASNRSIGVLVVGGQTLCLLLTLLAVPVFYSLFDDMKELPLFRKIFRRRETKRAVPTLDVAHQPMHFREGESV